MKSSEVFDGYVERSWRFLAELQRSAGMEFVVGRREGSYLWNIENTRRILECGNSGGVHSLGHRNPEILKTMRDALEVFDAGMWTMPTAEALSFQDAIAATTPSPELNRTILTLSSTDSIDLAIMFSFRVTGRRKALAYRYGYHGHGGFAALVTGSDAEGLFDHYALPREHSEFFPDYGSLAAIAPHITKDCAAVILEPLNYETFQPAPSGFLESVAELCRANGTLLIIDETRTGLGRSGRFWMSSHYSVEPDMLILGKGLGAGLYPVSALVATKAVYDKCMNDGHWGFMSSMAGSPIGALVASKVVEMTQRPALLSNVAQLESGLTQAFHSLSDQYPEVYEPAWVKGGIAALGLKAAGTEKVIRRELFKRGVLCHSVSEISPRVVKFFPCLTSEPDVIHELTEALSSFASDYRKGAISDG
jgi:acetylornithine aminotransferase